MKNIRCKRTVTLMYIYEWHFQVEFIHQTQIICPNGKKPTDLWKWKIRFQKDKSALDWCSDMSNLRKMTIAICHKQNEMEKGVLIIILFVSSCFGKKLFLNPPTWYTCAWNMFNIYWGFFFNQMIWGSNRYLSTFARGELRRFLRY